MRAAMGSVVVILLATPALAQPLVNPEPWRPKVETSVNVKVLGPLNVREPIDSDVRTLTTYTRHTGVEVFPGSAGVTFPFELFLGERPEFTESAKKLKDRWVVVEGELVVVHGPMRLVFGDFSGPGGTTRYDHAKPRYVIRVRRLELAAQPESNERRNDSVRFTVQGFFETNGKNPTLADLRSKKDHVGSYVLSDPCDFLLSLGEHDEWLPRAKELNRKPAIVEGDLKFIGGVPGSGPAHPRGPLIDKPGYFFLSVTNLKPVTPQPKNENK